VASAAVSDPHVCPRCGAAPDISSARFCGHCGAPLTAALRRYHGPPHLKLKGRPSFSCPECGEPMRLGFRHVCRNCGAELCMVPMVFHPNHVRVYVKGLRAAGAMLIYDIVWYAIVLGALALIGAAMTHRAPVKDPARGRRVAGALDRSAAPDLASIVRGGRSG
jgi:ribosomal protein L37E